MTDNRKISAAELGQGLKIVGNTSREVGGLSPLSHPRRGHLTYAKPGVKITPVILQSLSENILVCDESTASSLESDSITLLITNEPRLTFMRLAKRFFSPEPPAGYIEPTAVIDKSSSVSSRAYVGAHCFVGEGCAIEDGCIIHPNVTIYHGVIIGKNTIVNSGTVIGADGFGYEKNENGEMEKFPHFGGVVIGEGVEIGSNTSIDRGTLGDTVIRDRVKIDNQCHISHNVEIGEDSVVIAQSMVGGSVKIGRGCWIAPSASLINQVVIEDGATVGLGAVVVKRVASGSTVMGAPAEDNSDFTGKRKLLSELFKSSKEST